MYPIFRAYRFGVSLDQYEILAPANAKRANYVPTICLFILDQLQDWLKKGVLAGGGKVTHSTAQKNKPFKGAFEGQIGIRETTGKRGSYEIGKQRSVSRPLRQFQFPGEISAIDA